MQTYLLRLSSRRKHAELMASSNLSAWSEGTGPRPSRITRKSYGPRVPNRTMVAKFDRVLLCWFRNGQASSPRRDENRWQGKPKPLRNHMAANRAAGAEARTISAQSVGLESKKTSGRGEVFFLDFPLYRTYQHLDGTWSIGYGPHIVGRYNQQGIAGLLETQVQPKTLGKRGSLRSPRLPRLNTTNQ